MEQLISISAIVGGGEVGDAPCPLYVVEWDLFVACSPVLFPSHFLFAHCCTLLHGVSFVIWTSLVAVVHCYINYQKAWGTVRALKGEQKRLLFCKILYIKVGCEVLVYVVIESVCVSFCWTIHQSVVIDWLIGLANQFDQLEKDISTAVSISRGCAVTL